MGSLAQYYCHFKSIEELEQMMLDVLDDHAGGKSTISWSVGDSSANKMAWQNLTPATRASEIGQALSLKEPTIYPPEKFMQVTRTSPIFRSPNNY